MFTYWFEDPFSIILVNLSFQLRLKVGVPREELLVQEFAGQGEPLAVFYRDVQELTVFLIDYIMITYKLLSYLFF